MRGTVETGLGKAAGFTQVPWVLRELENRLAIRPFPGTLNVRLEQAADLDAWARIKGRPGIQLDRARLPLRRSSAIPCW